MIQTTKKTVIVSDAKPNTWENLIYYVLGAVEILLFFRLIFKLTGANPVSWFVNLIYTLSQIFVLPFIGIFHTAVSQGVETASVLEPATVVAMIVYAILVWGIIWLIDILSGRAE
ncbi:YggT family protein [soil metagenome]